MEQLGKLMRPSPLESLLAIETQPAEQPATQASAAGNKAPAAPALAALTRIEISSAGQLLGRLLLAAQTNGQPALQATQPLLPAAATELITDTPQLAAALRDAISFSGLFYESHLGEWIANGRSKENILQEPQARLAAHAQIDEAPLAQLVQSQLDTLETRQLHWQGQAWPGQPVMLCIEEHAAQDTAQDTAQTELPDTARHWSSTVNCALPSLGMVRARLVLQEDRLQLKLHAENAESVARLRAHGGLLSASLDACGMQLDTLSTQVNDDAGA